MVEKVDKVTKLGTTSMTLAGRKFTRIVAFSVDILSDGNPSLFHPAISASSVSRVRKSKSSVIGMGVCEDNIMAVNRSREGSKRA